MLFLYSLLTRNYVNLFYVTACGFTCKKYTAAYAQLYLCFLINVSKHRYNFDHSFFLN